MSQRQFTLYDRKDSGEHRARVYIIRTVLTVVGSPDYVANGLDMLERLGEDGLREHVYGKQPEPPQSRPALRLVPPIKPRARKTKKRQNDG